MRLIDGDALQQEFEDLAAIQWNKDTCTTCARAFKESAERVEDAKTVDAVERKRGEWVDNGLDSIGFMGIEYRLQKCSNCGETIAKAPMQRLPNFCSNCGADMRGENNG